MKILLTISLILISLNSYAANEVRCEEVRKALSSNVSRCMGKYAVCYIYHGRNISCVNRIKGE